MSSMHFNVLVMQLPMLCYQVSVLLLCWEGSLLKVCFASICTEVKIMAAIKLSSFFIHGAPHAGGL